MIQKNKTYKPFVLGLEIFRAENCIGNVLINPKLPVNFDCTANDMRPLSHQKFIGVRYITTYSEADFDPATHTDDYADKRRAMWAESGRDKWFKAWPNGIRYDVYCLDGGAWDRPTSWGCFATLDEALNCAKSGRARHCVPRHANNAES